ncbi:MAG: hypothetical protein H6696_05410 [Deferribacteres bacterium]|nr:hypothetical protein [candidate division KSB1 bacterium]MCB9501355.1 hypothetical protein [Deferribacteres bacterium]
MNSWDIIKAPLYRGKMTCCHSQALLTAFFNKKETFDLWMFESLTTVPFGIKHVPGDPNRLLDCHFDPDLGLDRVLEILEIPYEVKFWIKDTEGFEALKLLKNWCSESPVVLGPLNMNCLPYFFHGEVFYNMDHYIIALGFERGKFQICDPEGVMVAFLSEDDLLNAWHGDQIPEGRGKFIMRRVLGKVNTFNGHQEILIRTLQLAIKNLVDVRQKKYGGEKALQVLADRAFIIETDISLKHGLTFVIPTRIQRCIIIQEFVKKILEYPFAQAYTQYLAKILLLLDRQVQTYSQILANIIDRVPGALSQLPSVAILEGMLTDLFVDIGEKL